MNSANSLSYRSTPFNHTSHQLHNKSQASFSSHNERKILQVFLLGRLNQVFSEIFETRIQQQNDSEMECYTMDTKIIQLLIQGIVDTGEYTLEGIAYYTRIPFDVIYDLACGITNQFSITPWAKIVDLYIQVKPDVAQMIIDKLLEIRDKNRLAFISLLTQS